MTLGTTAYATVTAPAAITAYAAPAAITAYAALATPTAYAALAAPTAYAALATPTAGPGSTADTGPSTAANETTSDWLDAIGVVHARLGSEAVDALLGQISVIREAGHATRLGRSTVDDPQSHRAL